MKNHRLVFRQVDRDKFHELVAGKKTIETRAATPKYKDISKNDKLTFVCGEEEVSKKVIEVKRFSSIRQMLNELDLSEILPSVKDLNEAITIYHSFPGYKEKIEKHGIVALRLGDFK